jgi:hypothetical protein
MRQIPLCPQSGTWDPKIPRTAKTWVCKVCGAEDVSVIHSAELPSKLGGHKDARVPPAYRRVHVPRSASPKRRNTGR